MCLLECLIYQLFNTLIDSIDWPQTACKDTNIRVIIYETLYGLT